MADGNQLRRKLVTPDWDAALRAAQARDVE